MTFSAIVTSYGSRVLAFSAAALSIVAWRVSGSADCASAVVVAPITNEIDVTNPNKPLKRIADLPSVFCDVHARIVVRLTFQRRCHPGVSCRGFAYAVTPQ
jgi:hypothetical protein